MEILIQLIANGFVAGWIYAPVAIGFGLIYSTTRDFHFAHGLVYISAAYLFYALYVPANLSFLLSFVITSVAAVVLGLGIDYVIYRPLKKQGATPFIILLSSIGVIIFLENLILLAFGPERMALSKADITEGYQFGGVYMTKMQLLIVAFSILLCLAAWLLIKYTKTGRAIRAMSNDPEMAQIIGVSTNMIRAVVFSAGSALVVVPAVLVGLDTGISPQMGMTMTVMAAVAVFVGGVGHLIGAVFASLMIGMIQNLGVFYVEAKWQDLIAFGILLAFIIFRPMGLLGHRA